MGRAVDVLFLGCFSNKAFNAVSYSVSVTEPEMDLMVGKLSQLLRLSSSGHRPEVQLVASYEWHSSGVGSCVDTAERLH